MCHEVDGELRAHGREPAAAPSHTQLLDAEVLPRTPLAREGLRRPQAAQERGGLPARSGGAGGGGSGGGPTRRALSPGPPRPRRAARRRPRRRRHPPRSARRPAPGASRGRGCRSKIPDEERKGIESRLSGHRRCPPSHRARGPEYGYYTSSTTSRTIDTRKFWIHR